MLNTYVTNSLPFHFNPCQNSQTRVYYNIQETSPDQNLTVWQECQFHNVLLGEAEQRRIVDVRRVAPPPVPMLLHPIIVAVGVRVVRALCVDGRFLDDNVWPVTPGATLTIVMTGVIVRAGPSGEENWCNILLENIKWFTTIEAVEWEYTTIESNAAQC